MRDSDSPRAGDKTPKKISRRKLLAEGGRLSGLFACLPLLGLGSKSEAVEPEKRQADIRVKPEIIDSFYPTPWPWSLIYRETVRQLEWLRAFRLHATFEDVAISIRQDILENLDQMPNSWSGVQKYGKPIVIKAESSCRQGPVILYYDDAEDFLRSTVGYSPYRSIKHISVVGVHEKHIPYRAPDLILKRTSPPIPLALTPVLAVWEDELRGAFS